MIINLNDTIFLGLLQNTAILLSLSLLYGLFWLYAEENKKSYYPYVAGIIIGSTAVVLMFTPWTFMPGIVFDTRSVLLSISGLFFGTIPTIIGMAIAAVFRIFQGGDGMWMGLMVIASSGTIGIAWRRFRPHWNHRHYHFELLALGFLVHLAMLSCTVFLPPESIVSTLKTIALPLLLIYTPATLLIGMVMVRQSKNHLNRGAARKLLESEEKFRNLFQNHGAVKLIIDPNDQKILDANPAALNFYGYTLHEITQMKMHEINTLSNDELDAEIHKVLNKEKNFFEFRHQLKDGTIRDVEVFSSSIGIGKDHLLHSIIHDVTEKKRYYTELIEAKERAEENDKLKTAFLMNISHELRTPLNGIIGFASLLSEGKTIGDKVIQFSNIIKQSGNRLLGLVNNIIDISRIESGVEKVDISDVQPELLFDEVIEQLNGMAQKKNITLEKTLPIHLQPLIIRTDAQKLHQILTNLVNNAIKFSEKGSVKLTYDITDDEITISIADDGIGIDPIVQDKVFNRFFQAHSHLSTDNNGLGLGLTITKALVTLLKGSIKIQSTPGQGTTFFVSLPLNW